MILQTFFHNQWPIGSIKIYRRFASKLYAYHCQNPCLCFRPFLFLCNAMIAVLSLLRLWQKWITSESSTSGPNNIRFSFRHVFFISVHFRTCLSNVIRTMALFIGCGWNNDDESWAANWSHLCSHRTQIQAMIEDELLRVYFQYIRKRKIPVRYLWIHVNNIAIPNSDLNWNIDDDNIPLYMGIYKNHVSLHLTFPWTDFLCRFTNDTWVKWYSIIYIYIYIYICKYVCVCVCGPWWLEN